MAVSAAVSFTARPRIAQAANWARNLLVFASAAIIGAAAHASSMGMLELPADTTSGPVTVFYPATGKEQSERRGVFRIDVAIDAPLAPAAERLIVISHGSPASPWVYLDLVRTLVNAGFTVALPEHYADNHKDGSQPGPPSWKRRPLEVTQAIDRLEKDPRFASTLDFKRIGMYGMSAGGHTALTLAGGRWSPSRLRAHCHENIRDDFQACAGLSTSLTGGMLDGIKQAVVRAVNDWKFDDSMWYAHHDPRIVAVVAGVPFAADFDPQSFIAPKAALAIISARADKWLIPAYHSDFVLRNCQACERLLDFPTGGHSALLSPLPPLSGLAAALLADSPDFRRESEVPRLNTVISHFFVRHLLDAGIAERNAAGRQANDSGK